MIYFLSIGFKKIFIPLKIVIQHNLNRLFELCSKFMKVMYCILFEFRVKICY